MYTQQGVCLSKVFGVHTAGCVAVTSYYLLILLEKTFTLLEEMFDLGR